MVHYGRLISLCIHDTQCWCLVFMMRNVCGWYQGFKIFRSSISVIYNICALYPSYIIFMSSIQNTQCLYLIYIIDNINIWYL